MIHRWMAGAAAAAALTQSMPAFAEDADAAPPPAKARFGDAGDVVLGNVLGLSTYREPTAMPLGGIGAASGIGLAGAGPAAEVAWVSVTSSETQFTNGATWRSSGFRVAPSVDVFVAHRVSLGGMIGVRRSVVSQTLGPQTSEVALWDATFLPRVGYAIPLGDAVTIWPRARAGLTVHAGSIDVAPVLRAGLDAPLVFAVSRHVLLDVGPDLSWTRQKSDAFDTRILAFGVKGGLSLVF